MRLRAEAVISSTQPRQQQVADGQDPPEKAVSKRISMDHSNAINKKRARLQPLAGGPVCCYRVLGSRIGIDINRGTTTWGLMLGASTHAWNNRFSAKIGSREP